MSIRGLAFFAVGYVLGSKAGRERYEAIAATAQQASKRLERWAEEKSDSSGTSGRSASAG